MLVKIEQRLQDSPRILMFPADEAFFFGLPVLMGMLGKVLIPGVIVGFVLWMIWRRLKGDGGLVMMIGALYWYLPSSVNVFAGLPDSSVSVWEG